MAGCTLAMHSPLASATTWRARQAGASWCASRISTSGAHAPTSSRRSSRIWLGSACPGTARSCANRSTSPSIGGPRRSSLRPASSTPCFATRAEIASAAGPGAEATDPDGAPLYPGLHKQLPRRGRAAPGCRRALRAAPRHGQGDRGSGPAARRPSADVHEMHAEGRQKTIRALPARWGEAVIVRKDVPASYHLAVVVDDARQRVSHVTRGRDLFAATDLHRCCRFSSACRSRSITTIASSPTRPAASSPRAAGIRACAACARRGSRRQRCAGASVFTKITRPGGEPLRGGYCCCSAGATRPMLHAG